MDNKKKLKILQWFANGIINKTSEFVALADWNDTDIIAISETRLTAKQRLYIAGWYIQRRDRRVLTG